MIHRSSAVRFEQGHVALLYLCDELEHIADGLPDRIDREACRALGMSIAETMVTAHRAEAQWLFPALLQRAIEAPELPGVVSGLAEQHRRDQYLAEEVREALLGFAEGKPSLSPDALGYLLRSFFDGQRRHIALERELAAPLLAGIRLH